MNESAIPGTKSLHQILPNQSVKNKKQMTKIMVNTISYIWWLGSTSMQK